MRPGERRSFVDRLRELLGGRHVQFAADGDHRLGAATRDGHPQVGSIYHPSLMVLVARIVGSRFVAIALFVE